MRIGIDVGGTNTDAVLIAGRHDEDVRVVAAVKTPTTEDVTTGVLTAIGELLADAPDGFERAEITAVMIGTTHFTNAVVEARRLTPTAVVRLGLPATTALPPLTGWPARLRTAVGDRWYLCHGGYEYDGSQLSTLDPDELRRAAADLAAAGVRSVAVSSVFAPVNGTMEDEAAELLRDEVPELRVSCSHEFGRIGLLERENATVLNAALVDLADELVDALTGALADAGITAPLLLSQNDGTLMDVEYGRRIPAATFASGPTNSMRGAGFLSGVADCAVIDVGGTTTDIGVLVGGFPRETTSTTDVAGIRTNWRMPDVLSLGIGGGSLVRHFSDGEKTTVGPDSVGFALPSRGLVFGGDTLTLTDVAVAAGLTRVGTTTALVRRFDQARARAVLAATAERIADAVDRMRTSPGPLPVVLVGGGSVVLPDTLPGLPDVRRPEHADVANAIGAAIAKVGGELDRVVPIADGTRVRVLTELKAEAVARAEAAGARPGSVEIVEIDEVPLAYLPGGATRVRVKAVGDLDLDRVQAPVSRQVGVSCA
ncbi:hydantoinase/oxoprolinase N-terminal domain-containing protein [Actinophytocola algeriensis]|uniref:N-methylhydantoinase A/oxoprolinase/acetone carboxylase beta subunit n=1 Tax=Actinophytocola algeriensis TaxID=1768010 RepID=A0A7W7VFL9_9PSEU|nr:hydantoinase/oxoprolinase family protein [Actinophytocola algeriensis]MBB4908488.1 N-methylhydantoinase A/oxoprolinase/acetone carboxylase beta subunit [Actinophytocola algeriensis]MBE1475125.1 N-methylhydantoinase A/oxoprolinase/acetone carboxylase beta subunit [Actinophytocola algeriensis]